MPDSFESFQTPKNSETVPKVPPSTSEISIRTMASDIELMGKSGGLPGQGFNLAQTERVAVSPDPNPPTGLLGVSASEKHAEASSGGNRTIIWIVVALSGAIILFAAGFYLAPIFIK